MPHGSYSARIIFALYFVFAVLATASISGAQSPPNLLSPSSAPDPAPIEAAPQPVADKRAENAELLRVAQRRLEGGDPTNSAAAQEVALYQTLDAVLAQQGAVDQQIKDLEARKLELEGKLQSAAAGQNEKTSCTFVELDALKDELATEQVRVGLVDDKLKAAKSALEKAERARADSDVKRRQSQEAAVSGKKESNAADLATAAEAATQAAKLATETVTLRKSEIKREELSLQVQELAVRLCQDRITRLSPLVAFSAADYETQIAEIKTKEDAANKSLLRAQTSLHKADVQFQQALKEQEAHTGDGTIATEKVDAARWSREKLSDEIDSLTQRLQRLAQLRVAWNHRFTNASADHSTPNKQAFDELKTWQKETRTILDELAADLRAQILRMRDLRGSLTAVTKKIDAVKDGPADVLPWLETQRSQIEATLRIHESNLVTIENSRRVHEKLLDEISRDVQILNPKALALGVWHQAEQIWYQEVTSIDGQSIWVGKIIVCLLVFSGGWMCARISSAVFANSILRRFRLSKDATAAVRTLVFYSLLAAVSLIALRTVNVPLTAFTILGGALAIGFGFGSQALVNNFIGGLIMLAERPVRLGERISFGQFDGVVEDVGFRCTKLRTLTDHLVTIPNSTLVNESIENIARRRTIRRLMNVTITYDTPREKVEAAVHAIRNILNEKDIRERIHPIVGFEEFPPRVYFNDYNSESLNILVVYWYSPADWWPYNEHCERVNYRIMEEFTRLGVEFAFPSRTVYLVNQEKKTNTPSHPHTNGAKAHAVGPYN